MIPTVKLNNGVMIPLVGLGTSQMKTPAETVGDKTALCGLPADTATMYGNEELRAPVAYLRRGRDSRRTAK